MPKCPKDCKKPDCVFFRKTVIPSAAGDDNIILPENGDFCNMLVVYEATGNAYLFDSAGVPTLLSTTDYTRLSNLPTINGKIILGDMTLEDLGIAQLVEAEAEERKTSDDILQRQIDALTVASDVVDIVGTYEELEEYDTRKLKENDIVKVLADETVGGATTYYRWVDDQWEYIGEEGPYYTKSETDALLDQKMDTTALSDYYTKTETNELLADKANLTDLANKQDTLVAGSNITIDPLTNVISATVPSLTNYYTKDETYSKDEVGGLISGVESEIPTSTSDLVNDSGFLTSIPVATSQLLGGIKVGSGLSITQDGTLSASAPSITVDSALSTTSENPVQNKVITTALNGKANTTDIPIVPSNVSAFYNDAGYVTSTTLAQNYYNKTETYTKAEVDNAIPTKTSELTNNGSDNTSTYVEADELAAVATSGSYNDLLNKPSAPVTHFYLVPAYTAGSPSLIYNDSAHTSQTTYQEFQNAILSGPVQIHQEYDADTYWISNVALTDIWLDEYISFYVDAEQWRGLYRWDSTDAAPFFQGSQDYYNQVQADWNATNTSSKAYIRNKPTKTSDFTNDGSDGTSTYLESDETAYKTASIPYGVCDGTSTSTAFTATVPGVTELRDGVCMWLKNGVVTSASGFTIDINSLGAKPVYSNMAAATRETTTWNVNYTMLFVYDSTRVEGGCWIFYRGYYSDANSIGYQLRTNSTALTATDRTRYYRLLFTSADNTQWVPANTQYDNSATSNKTINQRKINPFGRIVYLGNSTSYVAGAAVSATAVWDQYAFNLGYSFSKGSALTMTYPKPVYIKAAPQSDGSAIIDSTNPYVQDLPTTDDGKIYIYLGIAYSATNVEMVINHPVYYYKDGMIRPWTNQISTGASGEVYTITVTGGQQIGTYAATEWAISTPFEIVGYLSYLNSLNPEFSITKSDGTTATVASMVSDTDALAAAQYKFDIEGPQGESSSIIAHPTSVLESSNGFIIISGVYSLDETFYTGEADSLSIPPLRWKLVLNTDPNIPNASFVAEHITQNS